MVNDAIDSRHGCQSEPLPSVSGLHWTESLSEKGPGPLEASQFHWCCSLVVGAGPLFG